MTTKLRDVLCNLIYNKYEVCRLCFLPVERSDIRIHDEVVLDEDCVEEMSKILQFILGPDLIWSLVDSDPVCDQCLRTAISCYKFIKMCHENSQCLISAIDALTNVNLSNENKNIKTLFCAFDVNKSSIKQYYDARKPVCTPSAALKRFQKCVNNPSVSQRVSNFEKHQGFSINKFDTEIKFEDDTSGLTFENNLETETICTILMDENRSEKFQCNKCFKTTSTFWNMQRHYKMLHIDRPKTQDTYSGICKECGKCFKSRKALSIHEKCHNTVVCTKCDKTFCKLYIKRHACPSLPYKRVKKQKFNGICSECGMRFRHKSSLKHHELQHKKEVTSCPICKKSFKSKYLFKRHTCNLEHVLPPKKYICDNCGKRFCHLRNLSTHIKYDHGSGKPLKCAFCPATFVQNSSLKNHMVKHTGEKNFECKICGGKFVTKMSLVYHTRLHTGEKPYKCKLCDERFLSSSRRADHFRRAHMKPSLACGRCPAKFKDHGGLARHNSRHLNPQSSLYIPGIVKDEAL